MSVRRIRANLNLIKWMSLSIVVTGSGIKGLRLHDSRHVSGNRLPATIAFDKHIGGSVLAAGILALVAALSRSEPVHHRRVAVNADLQFIQLERLELDGP